NAPESAFLRVIRTRRVAGGGANPPIALLDEVLVGKVLAASVAPLLAHPLVEVFSERLGKTIRERLGHDGVVIVMSRLEFQHQLHQAVPRSDCERPEIIADQVRLSAMGGGGPSIIRSL